MVCRTSVCVKSGFRNKFQCGGGIAINEKTTFSTNNNTAYLYRVVAPKGSGEPVTLLPGDEGDLTGFWTPHLEVAWRLWWEREHYVNLHYNGSTWARVYRIPRSKASIISTPQWAKLGHDDRYDRDEVFVTELHAAPEDITEKIREIGAPWW